MTIIPIVIRLELKQGAPYVDLNMKDHHQDGNTAGKKLNADEHLGKATSQRKPPSTTTLPTTTRDKSNGEEEGKRGERKSEVMAKANGKAENEEPKPSTIQTQQQQHGQVTAKTSGKKEGSNHQETSAAAAAVTTPAGRHPHSSPISNFPTLLSTNLPHLAVGAAAGSGTPTVMRSSSTSVAAVKTPPTLPEGARHGRAGGGDNKPSELLKTPITQEACFGNRNYAELRVETYAPATALVKEEKEKIKGTTNDAGKEGEGGTSKREDSDSMSFFYGNPFVEQSTGILHFYKKMKIPSTSSAASPSQECTTLCMLAVPAFVTCRELIQFVAPMGEHISEMKVIRDDTPNQYMVLLKFKAPGDATSFYHEYNEVEFNSIEPEKCTLLFVERIETTLEQDGGSLPVDSLAELPTCSVCLERLDDGVLTILCNHSFHAECLHKWADTTCPVCRHSQTPDLVPDQACFDCGRTTDLWMCLICGNIGCGRYAEAHAFHHYEATSHIFTLQVGGKLVWDYVGDNYVHRLVQGATDGKMVEYMGPEDMDKENEKLSAIQLEYSCLLTSQLENQRFYFEEKLREAEQRHTEFERDTKSKFSTLELKLHDTRAECSQLRSDLDKAQLAKQQQEKKHQATLGKLQKVQAELESERQLCALMQKDKEVLAKQREELEQSSAKEASELRDQLHDLMMHFEAQAKIQAEAEKGEISREELSESNVQLQQQQQKDGKGKRKAKK